eukprot:gene69355-biopygen27292
MDGKNAAFSSPKTIPERIRQLLDQTRQCLIAARDGHGSQSYSDSLTQLYKMEDLLSAGAIPNATMGLVSQPWSPVMKSILKEAIKAKAMGQVILYQADLIVVGNGASGKTTLLHRMKLDRFWEGATMTDGIDMTHLRIGQVYFFGRDAAGQPIYAHTISLFFEKDAIYLAVFNPRVENNVDALTQFLHMVQNTSPQARVVLATTRSDELAMDGNMRDDLRQRFPM